MIEITFGMNNLHHTGMVSFKSKLSIISCFTQGKCRRDLQDLKKAASLFLEGDASPHLVALFSLLALLDRGDNDSPRFTPKAHAFPNTKDTCHLPPVTSTKYNPIHQD